MTFSKEAAVDLIQKTRDLHQNDGLNCSQAIMTAFGDKTGIDPDRARLFGRPWGGGIGHLARTCGYLTGAVLVLACAFNDADENKARQKTALAVRELFQRFENKYGTSQCKDLLGADMTTEEGRKRIADEKLVAKHCYAIGEEVAGIVESLIEKLPKK